MTTTSAASPMFVVMKDSLESSFWN